MMRITTDITCYGGESTHWLIVRVPVRDGRPARREESPPVVRDYEFGAALIVDALRSVATRAERRELDAAIRRLLGEEATP